MLLQDADADDARFLFAADDDYLRSPPRRAAWPRVDFAMHAATRLPFAQKSGQYLHAELAASLAGMWGAGTRRHLPLLHTAVRE